LSAIGDGFEVRSLAVTLRHGAAFGWHRHPWGQLVYGASGVMSVATAAAAWLVPATRAIWLPAGLDHQIGFREAPAVLEIAPLLRELILHILKIGMLSPAAPGEDRLTGLLIDLLLAARRQDLALPMPSDPRALALARRLHASPGDPTPLADLAGDHGASLRTLQRLFPQETGLTLEAWRQKARLIHAAAAISSGATVTQAAFDCGYDSPGAFSAAFKRQFQSTPGRYAQRSGTSR
jgi:AraC-like DNA-binding protein